MYAPTDAEIDSAQAIIGAFNLPENAGKGAIQLNGRMVERLHGEMARRTLSIAQGIADLSAAAAS
jgi:citrate lyase subunit beta / citryl-CoA lyase